MHLAPRKKPNHGERRKLWVNFTLSGEPHEIYLELKKRGPVHNTRDTFTQGLRHLQEKIMEIDLKKAQLAASRRLNREFNGEEF
jgi:hypothetical protein